MMKLRLEFLENKLETQNLGTVPKKDKDGEIRKINASLRKKTYHS